MDLVLLSSFLTRPEIKVIIHHVELEKLQRYNERGIMLLSLGQFVESNVFEVTTNEMACGHWSLELFDVWD